MPIHPHVPLLRSRREFLTRAGAGFGALAFSYLLARDGYATTSTPNPKNPIPKAKSVIFLFMEGGPSHLDLLDPKPALERLSGQPMPASFGRVITAMGTSDNTLLPSKRKWKQHGQSGHHAFPDDEGCLTRGAPDRQVLFLPLRI